LGSQHGPKGLRELEAPGGAPVPELRAVYGGLELAIGVFLVLCVRRGGDALELGLALSFLLLSALAAFRGIGMGHFSAGLSPSTKCLLTQGALASEFF